ncbi:MAG: 6-carboxytetrahydropterin synthase [Planctomycetota bacterium]|nr:6-carboxytetrahydropterin synthase [Planctomycetota bacterium]MDA1105743.1 6-carboxytetrahydropterin synthase [Planctomycetota bacterium]
MTACPDHPSCVTLLRDYDFAASHRLALLDRTDDENLAIFGKCSSPNGHGHNYRLRVAVELGDDPAARSVDLDRIVETHVLKHFDHKHLNLDTPFFMDRLPSVENIALTIHALLAEAMSGSPLKFVGVRVWETDRTSASTSERV